MELGIPAQDGQKQRDNFARIQAGVLMRLADRPDATPFDRELAEWVGEGRVTQDALCAILEKLAEIINLMQTEGVLPSGQVQGFVDAARVEPLIEAIRCERTGWPPL